MKNKAVFLDRDGVINNDEGFYYIYKPEDLKINEGIAEGLRMLSEAGYKLIIVSNQSGVAKGVYTEDDVRKVHRKLFAELAEHDIKIDAAYFCPHHESVSECECRKPKPGMILQAIKEHNIDADISYLIGDSERDIVAGKRAGLKKCFLIKKNSSIIPVCKKIVEGYE
ncbi:MAG: HAD family hydrolase [Chlorobi bacterium]|nr:HAD family hydrolase [Chlorobiota bacterium]